MDTLSVGHPVYELSQMYLAYLGFSETDPDDVKRFLGIDRETSLKFFNSSLKYYFEGKDDEFIKQAVNKARIIGYTRLLRRTIKRAPEKKDIIDNCIKQLCELVSVTETLAF